VLRIEFICLVVNRRSLDQIYPGGSNEFIKDWGPFNGRSSAYDDDLIKFGAMDPAVIDDLIRRLEDLGLVGLSQESGIKEWKSDTSCRNSKQTFYAALSLSGRSEEPIATAALLTRARSRFSC